MKKIRLKTFGLTLLTLLAVSYVGISPADGADGDVPAYEMPKVTPSEFKGDVRELPLIHRPATAGPPIRRPPRTGKPAAPAADVTPAGPEAVSAPRAAMPSPTQNFAGLSLAACPQCDYPPDPNGDVGLNHYIQAVNRTYAIWSKTGTLLASFTENQLWSGGGGTVVGGAGVCGSNSFGDPIVLYDRLADRFILTHIAFASSNGPFYQCIAASKTADPVSGGWWLYAVRMDPGSPGPPVGALNDYPKFGLWTDCLYMAANEFQIYPETFLGTSFASFSRGDLYSGAPLTWAVGFINAAGPFTMIPNNLLGKSAGSLPPAGTPSYFVSQSQTQFAFEVRKFTAGPNCGGGSGTLSGSTPVSQSPYGPLSDVPQPDTSVLLDSVDDRLMQKVQYRRVGNTESLWVVHNVQALGSTTVNPQWAQLDVTGGVIRTTPVQQQIYAPDTTLHRWMGSLAVDSQGNMALGYSTSNDSSPNFPSIAYSGRLAGDPLGTLPQSEVQLVAGGGSQTVSGRWGDYSAMSIDPVDDCTFWYTNEYYLTSGGNWNTRIGSFKFPSCTSGPTVTVAKAGNGSGTVTGSDGVIDCGPVCSETVPSGTQIKLTAMAASNSDFTGWSGGGCSGTGTCTVTVTSAITVTATFTLKTFSLTVVRAGTGSGTVMSSDGAINCGSACSETVASGTGVTLTATPGANSTFAGWSGGGCSGTGTCTVTVTSATTVTATFTLTGVTLTVTKLGSGLGTVTSSDGNINCGATCSFVYGAGSSVTLSAMGSGATFKQWGGACSGTVATCTITLNTTQSVTATFSETFTDGSGSTSQIVPATTVIKAVHVLELRTAIDNLRAVNGLTAYSWTDPTLTAHSTPAKRLHFLDLRTALSAVCAVFPGRCTAYTDPTITAGQTIIKAVHLNELRANVRALE